MNKQRVIIIAGAIVVVLLIVGGVMLLNRDKDKGTSSSPSEASNTSTSSNTNSDSKGEDLGLCTAVDTATIKSALGSAAANLTGPQNSGVTSIGDGDKGQTCVYPFVEGGALKNSFYTDLVMYSQASFDKVSSFTATSGTPVSGVGDKAMFNKSEPLSGGTEFAITAIKGTNVYHFVIVQPSSGVTFNDASALAALTTIAQSAKLK